MNLTGSEKKIFPGYNIVNYLEIKCQIKQRKKRVQNQQQIINISPIKELIGLLTRHLYKGQVNIFFFFAPTTKATNTRVSNRGQTIKLSHVKGKEPDQIDPG